MLPILLNASVPLSRSVCNVLGLIRSFLLIETTTGLKYEKQRAVELFKNFSYLNDLFIQRDNIALHTLEQEFSKEGKSALCFDGNKVSVWQDRNSTNFWNIDYYLKNFQFRFEYEPETRHLKDETELTRWLTFQFLRIREEIESKEIYAIKKSFKIPIKIRITFLICIIVGMIMKRINHLIEIPYWSNF